MEKKGLISSLKKIHGYQNDLIGAFCYLVSRMCFYNSYFATMLLEQIAEVVTELQAYYDQIICVKLLI